MMAGGDFKFKGLCNFRDAGEIPSIYGASLKKGMLFRSDDLSYAATEDLSKIKELGLKSIIDLRTPNERKFKYLILNGITAKVFNIPVFFGADISRQEYFRLILRESRNIDLEGMVKDIYHRFAFDRTEAVKEVFDVISGSENFPVLIHCTAGKDRTGFIIALIQLVCGVSREDTLREYLKTNTFIERRIKKTAFLIRVMSLFRISKAQMKPMFEVRAENLERILDKIYAKYDTIENYLIQACGIDPPTITAVRNILL